MNQRLQLAAHHTYNYAKTIFIMVMLMWLPELIDTVLLGQGLNTLGIRPRSSSGLIGIVLAPFLHSGLNHLVANTVPFAVLAFLILARNRDEFWLVTLTAWLLSGLGVWLMGPPNTVHIGASGLIFGYLGFLLLRGFFDKHIGSILIAIGVALAYGSVLLGLLPLQNGVSWQGHLFGFIAGGLAALLISKK